jgi:hypothetical protein
LSRPITIGGLDWGANAEDALQDCGCAHDANAVDKIFANLWLWRRPASERKSGGLKMAKIDLDSLSIEELAGLRDSASEKLAEKVAARQAELEAELEKLSQYGKPARKSAAAAPIVKAKKSDNKSGDEAKEPIAKAA